MIYITSSATWHKKQKYIWFRDGYLSSFWDITTLPVEGGRITPYGYYRHHLHTIRCCLTQETIYVGWGFKRALRYLITSLSRGTGPLRMVMTYIPSAATWHKKQEYTLIKGGDLNSFRDIWALPVSWGQDHSVWLLTIICYLTQETKIYMV
jgi:hypothetical protein